MKIPLKILIGNNPSTGALRKWDEIIDEWKECSTKRELNKPTKSTV